MKPEGPVVSPEGPVVSPAGCRAAWGPGRSRAPGGRRHLSSRRSRLDRAARPQDGTFHFAAGPELRRVLHAPHLPQVPALPTAPRNSGDIGGVSAGCTEVGKCC